MWSPIVEGDTIGIEITLPSRDALSDFSFRIEKVSHIYAPMGQRGHVPKQLQCANHVDVQCRSRIVGDQQDAVGRIVFEVDEFTVVCSGTLLNDTRDDGYIPYFLTAHHCVSTNAVARTIEARWFYQRASCGSERIDPRDETTLGGAVVLATSAAQDSTLLRFRRSLPGGLTYSGWSADPLSYPAQVYGIHHPDGDVKKYAGGRATGHEDLTLCDDPENTVGCQTVRETIVVPWSDGTTEGGSSGSGLFDGENLIGVLFAGGGTCAETIDNYGPFQHFYPRIRRWLSPDPYSLPFVTAASNRSRPGFVRLINHSERAGTVTIRAIDDTGERFGPVSLRLDAQAAVHLTSADLENGNAEKGLSAGVGDGTGNWRLELSSGLAIEALAYIRTPDGFVTSMHEVAAATDEGSNRYHVPFVNPGSNSNQQSLLRLINPGSGTASIVITGVDDAGDAAPLGEVSLTLEAGAARMLSARDLERGAEGLSGRLGDGAGKWRLSVSGDRPLQVMSLLQLPTGHLANLSRGRDGVAVGTPPPLPDAPDLVVQSASVSDSSPTAGQSFTLRATVRNSGAARSAATTLRYYRSSDATISTSDTAVGTDPVSTLSASGTSAESISLTASPSAGTYLLRCLRGHRNRRIGYNEQLFRWCSDFGQWQRKHVHGRRCTSGGLQIHNSKYCWWWKPFKLWWGHDYHPEQRRIHPAPGWDQIYLSHFWRLHNQKWSRHSRHHRRRRDHTPSAAVQRAGLGRSVGFGQRQQLECGAVLHVEGDGPQLGHCSVCGDHAALLPLLGRDDFHLGHGGRYGPGERAIGFGHQRGVNQPGGAVECGHALLWRVRQHCVRRIEHTE